jgi:outer membrane immunogenic protein
MRNRLISSVAGVAFSFAATGLAFAADMPVKAPPPAPAPVPTWTGFYGGIQFGGGWSDEAVNYSGNDPLAAVLLSGTLPPVFFPGNQAVANGYRIPQSGLVGGVEAGYNWQWSNWLLGVEADFSLAGMSGTASGASNFVLTSTQTTTAEQSTDWYGTVRGRAGWLATPNLLLFGTGGFAYGRVRDSADYTISNVSPFLSTGPGGFSVVCSAGVACMVGSSSAIRTGWTAGGGVEWLLDQHWSAKIEYQFVDLGIETARITAVAVCTVAICGTSAPTPSSFNAAFRDSFNVVRLGLNYRF